MGRPDVRAPLRPGRADRDRGDRERAGGRVPPGRRPWSRATAAWFAVPAVALRRAPAARAAALAVPGARWRCGSLAAASRSSTATRASFGVGVYAAGMAAALLLGNVPDTRPGPDRAGGHARPPRGSSSTTTRATTAGEFLVRPGAVRDRLAGRLRAARALGAGRGGRGARRRRRARARGERAPGGVRGARADRARAARRRRPPREHDGRAGGRRAGRASTAIAARRRRRWPRSRRRAGRRSRSCTACSGSCARPATTTTWRRSPASAQLAAAGGEHAATPTSPSTVSVEGERARAAADGRRLGLPDRAGGADEHAQALGGVARRRAPALLARRARGRDRRRRRAPQRRGAAGAGRARADRHARARRAARRPAQRRARRRAAGSRCGSGCPRRTGAL